MYSQIGTGTVVGLAAKYAIRIAELAKLQRDHGDRRRERFILGVLPLGLASGAGPASRYWPGTWAFGGMITAAILGFCSIRTKKEGIRNSPGIAGGNENEEG